MVAEGFKTPTKTEAGIKMETKSYIARPKHLEIENNTFSAIWKTIVYLENFIEFTQNENIPQKIIHEIVCN